MILFCITQPLSDIVQICSKEYSGHAVKIAKEVKLNDWDGIVIVSGDGLIHEVSKNDFMK